MKNEFVAEILYKIADLIDIKEDNFFKTRAYRLAAQRIEVLEEDIQVLVKEKRLKDIPGIGEAISKKITELVETGKIEFLEELKKEIPESLLSFLEIPTLGPRKVSVLYKELKIKTIEELRKACEKGKLRDLEGFGEITERNILRGITLKENVSGRFLLNLAYENGEKYLNYMKKCKDVDKASIAGSLRRMKETIGDLDILASSKKPDNVMDYFSNYEDVQRVLLKGNTKTSVLLNDNIQVDLRVVDKKSYGAALQYFTGSKEHNVVMRSIAIKNGYKLNEYGLFEKDTEKYVSGESEEDIYNLLGLKYIEPELRENKGEIEEAQKNKLPNLLDYNDINGDFHVHSSWSDGSNSFEEIANSCKKMGYSFVCITDHSQSLKVANGLSEKRVEKKIKEIEKLNKKLKDFTVLCGTECDIKPDGTLDYPDKILEKFDFVYGGIHTTFKMTEKQATKRITDAMQNEYVNCIAHPTCRMIGKREPFDLDMDAIIKVAKDTNTFLEINAFPDRLDLKDSHAKLAKEKNVKIIIGTDSHNISTLNFMRFGIATAKRGWLEKKDVINTYKISEIKKMFGLS